jgi:hypothetical protein
MTDVPANATSSSTASHTPSARTIAQAPTAPDYDPESVSRVASGVRIRVIDLVAAHFSRKDDTALPLFSMDVPDPELGIDVTWALADDAKQLGCVITFATIFGEPEPYRLTARFRLVYDLDLMQAPASEDLNQFANWNAVFNAWPYWREYLSSTLNRARLPHYLVPVMGVPLLKNQQAPTNQV